jgi:hypothetical protein
MPPGRPTLYHADYAEIARKACTEGATNLTLAERIGVARGTIDNWIATIPEFGEAVREGRAVADDAVVSALYARATGFKQPATKFFHYHGETRREEHTVHLPPDTHACIFWLRNRRPEEWREKHEAPSEAKDDHDEAWEERLAAAAERARNVAAD